MYDTRAEDGVHIEYIVTGTTRNVRLRRDLRSPGCSGFVGLGQECAELIEMLYQLLYLLGFGLRATPVKAYWTLMVRTDAGGIALGGGDR